mmetsp:Transcript_9360/g.27805  ORF Transcript_9360/g.27805 Transcript_9360/m.27805 type:complete len:144 (-) Transcript_9360:166-597(-)
MHRSWARALEHAEAAQPGRSGRWTLLHGEVVELSETLLEEHPGGCDVLLLLARRDCTEEFEAAGHSTSAQRWARTLIVSDRPKNPALAAEVPSPSRAPRGPALSGRCGKVPSPPRDPLVALAAVVGAAVGAAAFVALHRPQGF